MDKYVKNVYKCMLFSYERSNSHGPDLWANPFYREKTIPFRADMLINKLPAVDPGIIADKNYIYHYIYAYGSRKTLIQKIRLWIARMM